MYIKKTVKNIKNFVNHIVTNATISICTFFLTQILIFSTVLNLQSIF